jgi:O-antigen ligase
MQRPVLGHCFGGFWTTELRELISSHAHNGYLNLILDLGFVGILLMYIFFITCCFKAIKVMKNDFNWGALWICFLFMTVIYNITEPSIDGFSNQQMATLLFLLATSSNAIIVYQNDR